MIQLRRTCNMVSTLLAALVCCASMSAAQPVSCEEDRNCNEGHFCDPTSYLCQKCLSCQDLKREPPSTPKSCIKSFENCGPCLKDLMEDRDGGLACMPPATERTPGDSVSGSAVWISLGIGFALFFIIVLAFFIRYILKNKDILQFNVDTNIGASLPSAPVQYTEASAPKPPPPYSPPSGNEHLPPFRPGEETSLPLIEPFHPSRDLRRPFESQDRQNVSVYNPPAYVRLPRTHLSEDHSDVNENFSPYIQDDDDTTPSPWVPSTDINANGTMNGNTQPPSSVGSPSDFSTALALVRNTDLIHQPSNQITLRLQPLNGNEEASGGEETRTHTQSSARSAPSGDGNYNVMNVNQVINIIKPQL